jgi:hypothetical protein
MRPLTESPQLSQAILQSQDGVALEDGSLIGKLLQSKRLLRLALSAADHPFSKHHPNRGDERSRDDSCSTRHSGYNGGVGHAQLSVNSMVTMLGHPDLRSKGADLLSR